MTLDDLTVSFSHLTRKNILGDWRWLIGENLQPILIAASGDAFVQNAENGSIHVLDVWAGTLTQVASTLDEFKSLLSDRKFVIDTFAVEMIADLKGKGKKLAHGQLYSFKIPPVLGGAYVFENVEPTDIEVHFSLNGQIHEKARTVPIGTPVRTVTVK
jgi:hypothetical protein